MPNLPPVPDTIDNPLPSVALYKRLYENEKSRAEIYATTVEELDALPIGSAILLESQDGGKVRIKKWDGLWLGDAKDFPCSIIDGVYIIHWYAKARLLYKGDHR